MAVLREISRMAAIPVLRQRYLSSHMIMLLLIFIVSVLANTRLCSSSSSISVVDVAASVNSAVTNTVDGSSDSDNRIYSSSVPNSTILDSDSNNGNSSSSIRYVHDLLPWYIDFLRLPSDVPFPGSAWLDRMNYNINSIVKQNSSAATSTVPTTLQQVTNTTIVPIEKAFIWEGIQYTTVYAALLQNEPLRYPCRNFNAYLNSIFISNDVAIQLVQMTQSLEITHYIMCYIRNFIGAMIVYYGTAGIFHYFCYVHPIARVTFAQRTRPSPSIMINQIALSQGSLFLYVLLPVVDEYVVEQNWTRTYFTISEIGGIYVYLLYFVIYFALVEIGIYWMHRTLHTNKFLYKYVHMKHHQYNKPETLTPWASIAFHPLDGILQASPYFVVIFFIPCHYLTHVTLLFFTAIWATYIHDAMDWNINPIMGSKYHTVHHTHYIYNYGQVFTFCDYIWGTLRVPLEPTGSTKQRLLKMD